MPTRIGRICNLHLQTFVWRTFDVSTIPRLFTFFKLGVPAVRMHARTRSASPVPETGVENLCNTEPSIPHIVVRSSRTITEHLMSTLHAAWAMILPDVVLACMIYYA